MPKYSKFVETNCTDADEFWEIISPQNKFSKKPSNFIYRGQRDASWELMPNILRAGKYNPANRIISNLIVNGDEQVFCELRILESFIEHCDQMGLKIINDSVELREKHINIQNADKYFIQPSDWPSEEIIEVMALAQHHSVPTRLLDWSKRSFVATYFAASSALERKNDWVEGEKLALWALDIEMINLYPEVKIVKVPASASINLAAQAGLFTIHKQNASRGTLFSSQPLENEFGSLPNTPLQKTTLPVTESKSLLALCELYGVTAATLFPGFDGAARAVSDSINCWDNDL